LPTITVEVIGPALDAAEKVKQVVSNKTNINFIFGNPSCY